MMEHGHMHGQQTGAGAESWADASFPINIVCEALDCGVRLQVTAPEMITHHHRVSTVPHHYKMDIITDQDCMYIIMYHY